jgi:hypothetical protein
MLVTIMRILYGDLTQANCQADTLALLQRVVDVSVEVLRLHQQTDEALLAIQAEKNRLNQAIEDIDQFRHQLQQTIHTSFSDRAPDDVVSGIGQAVSATLQQHAQDGKTRLSSQVTEKITAVQAQITRLAGETFEALKRFFLEGGMPAARSTLRCSLDGSTYLAESEVVDAAGICCSYTLDATSQEFFTTAKRFGDLVPGKLEIPVGIKKAWMKKEPVSELVRIDDATLTQILDGEQAAEFRLTARSGGDAAGIAVRVDKTPQVAFKVYKLIQSEQPQAVPADLLTSEHTDALARFWSQLRPRIDSLHQARDGLARIRIDGKDVTEGRLYAKAIGLLIGTLAPIVREIDAHTLVQGELSLTVERDEEGKREVFFIRKDKLVQRILSLPEAQRQIFAPLGLTVGPDAGLMARKAASGPPRASAIREVAPSPERTVEVNLEATDVVKGVLLKDGNDPK